MATSSKICHNEMIVSDKQVSCDPDKVVDIVKLLTPIDAKALHCFIGMSDSPIKMTA